MNRISKNQAQIEAMADVIQYVLDHEHVDFLDNPAKEHVYYKAMAYSEGVEAADKYLKHVEEENENL